jgi:hypothetical protein
MKIFSPEMKSVGTGAPTGRVGDGQNRRDARAITRTMVGIVSSIYRARIQDVLIRATRLAIASRFNVSGTVAKRCQLRHDPWRAQARLRCQARRRSLVASGARPMLKRGRHDDFDVHRFGLLPRLTGSAPSASEGGVCSRRKIDGQPTPHRASWLALMHEELIVSNDSDKPRVLSDAQIQQFVQDGFVRIDRAFPRDLADEARTILWRDLPCDPNDPGTWTKPVIRLGMYTGKPFFDTANTPVLHAAFDQLVRAGRWLPCGAMGTFPVRFPSPDDAGDTGWHIDGLFGYEDNPDFMSWRANVSAKGRLLLMLFLFSDVGETDAPTRIRAGSHLDMARLLAPAGEEGLSVRDMIGCKFGDSGRRREVLAVGDAGTVYLCHPLLVHAAQIHRGTRPRFLAQPPLLARDPIDLSRSESDSSPVEAAIRLALRAPLICGRGADADGPAARGLELREE